MGREQKPDSPDPEDHRLSQDPLLSAGFGIAGRFIGETLRAFGPPSLWPFLHFSVAAELILNSTDPVCRGKGIHFGDGKPVILVPGHLGGDATLTPLSLWLRAIGYRPVMGEIAVNVDDRSLDERVAAALRHACRRIGRKAVMVAFNTGVRSALRVAAADPHHVSDVIALGLPAPCPPVPATLRLHVIESSRRNPASRANGAHVVDGSPSLLPLNPRALKHLSEILREIPISLLETQL
jgi:hypothetical protein